MHCTHTNKHWWCDVDAIDPKSSSLAANQRHTINFHLIHSCNANTMQPKSVTIIVLSSMRGAFQQPKSYSIRIANGRWHVKSHAACFMARAATVRHVSNSLPLFLAQVHTSHYVECQPNTAHATSMWHGIWSRTCLSMCLPIIDPRGLTWVNQMAFPASNPYDISHNVCVALGTLLLNGNNCSDE